MIGRLKDKTLSQGILYAINRKIGRFGKVTTLCLDTEKKRMELELELKGERERLRIVVRDYTVGYEEGRYLLRAGSIESSKEWLEILAREYLLSRPIEIPSRYGRMIDRLL